MRIQKRIAVYLSILAIGTSTVSAAHAVGPVGLARNNPFSNQLHRVPTGHNTLAPFAYILFCTQNPQDCVEAPPAEVSWNMHNERLITHTNRRVNRTIRPTNDRAEIWSADVRDGDCEDYALTKRRELIRSGLPAAALRMAVVVTPRGVGHAVLVVSTSIGDLVLDNRSNRILTPQQTDLTWIKIASGENPYLWASVQNEVRQSVDVASASESTTPISPGYYTTQSR